jgi:o-succinylbenzoate synthase
MKVERLILRFVRIPLRVAFENRWQRIQEWTKLLVEVHSDGAVGHGECMAMETPYYSYETIDTAWLAITRYLVDLFVGKTFEHPDQVAEAFAVISGHHEARGALECAFWEMYTRAAGVPLYQSIGGTRRPVRSGATVGVQKDVPAAVEAARRAVEAGYQRLKVKIKPGWDREPLAAIRAAFPAVTILADANGAYAEGDLDQLDRLDDFAPLILEQPFPRSAWTVSAALQARLSSPICLDESIENLLDVEQTARLQAARLINLKVGRVGGLSEAIRIHDRCAQLGLPVFIGSKTETGVGRWLNIALGTLSNVRYPSDVAASERYFVEDVVKDPITLSGPGTVEPLAGPGIGTDLDTDRLAKYTVKTAEFSA